MKPLSLMLAAAGFAAWSLAVPATAADFESRETYLPDYLACLDLAREEGQLIIEVAALHRDAKHDEDAAAHRRELKREKKSVHRERRRVECI